uniref:Amino acid transporter n=1 Tax=Poecilia reticulata TaxID=8081 RepID=A0A3P9PB25_POERE
MSEVELVEVARPEDNEKNERCSQPLDEVESIRDGFNIWIFLKRNAFLILTMAAVALGIGLGFALRYINMSEREITYLTFPGELLLRMLKMMVNMFPSNLVEACFRKVTTNISTNSESCCYESVIVMILSCHILLILLLPLLLLYVLLLFDCVDYLDCFICCLAPIAGTSDGINVVGLLVFSIAFGLILSSMGSEGKPLRDLFNCMNKAIMRLVSIVIWYSPVGIIFLLAGQVVKMTDAAEIGRDVGMYTLTVVTGLIIHGCVTLPLIYVIVTRKNPLRFYGGILQALSTAFGTSSSSATLPVTLRCMEENLKMDKQVTRFMLPVGATMNMDGSALYEAVAALFIAQVNDMDFNFGQIIVLSLVVTAASTGAPGIPQAGMVTMLIVLSSTGLPTEDISLLLMVDWILDRLRTATNVLGDCIGVGVVQHLSRHELQTSSPTETNLVLEENPPSKNWHTGSRLAPPTG